MGKLNNLKFFKFYFVYKEFIESVSVFKCKKLMLAIIDYAENRKTEIKLDKKTKNLFLTMKEIIDYENRLNIENGQSGASKRWEDRGAIKKNRGAIPKK